MTTEKSCFRSSKYVLLHLATIYNKICACSGGFKVSLFIPHVIVGYLTSHDAVFIPPLLPTIRLSLATNILITWESTWVSI